MIIIALIFLPITGKNQLRLSPKIVGYYLILVAFILGFIIYSESPVINRFIEFGLKRSDVWPYAYSLINEKPFTGWGFGISDYYVSAELKIIEWGIHNSYLILIAEIGFLGAIFWIMFFYKLLLLNLKELLQKQSKENNTPILRWTFLFILIISLYGTGESMFTALGSLDGFTFWFLTICNLVIIENRNRDFFTPKVTINNQISITKSNKML